MGAQPNAAWRAVGRSGVLRVMTPEEFQRIEAVFVRVAALPPERRRDLVEHFESLDFRDPIAPGSTEVRTRSALWRVSQ